MTLYPWLRDHFLFHLPTEMSHAVALNTLSWAAKLKCIHRGDQYKAPRQVMGLTFPNPVGLAAGFDKNGDYIDALAALGFGFIEVGTVTPRPQLGNPKPRLFRLPSAGALINRMGFNNKGVDHLVARLQKRTFTGILGVNIGKNRDTPLAQAADDYVFCLQRVAAYADYVAINISSPNTQGLRDLQKADALQALLATLKAEQLKINNATQRYVPLVVKIAPDLTAAELAEVAEIILAQKMDGVIATNTTLDRRAVAGVPFASEAGGLSGQPLLAKSTMLVRALCDLLQEKVPVIAVGGIFSAADAVEKLAAGAVLVQLYTGLVYQGAGLVGEVCGALG